MARSVDSASAVHNRLAEHVFDTLGDTPVCYFPRPAVCTRRRHAEHETATRRNGGGTAGSASLFGDIERGAYGSPHPLGVNPRLQRPVHRPPTELGEHVIMSQSSRPDRAELLVHPLPEVGDSHWFRLGTCRELS
jgi:hypothetical protein